MKRILATILSVVLVATLAFSGTVAYLTDDESAINVMTVGKVNVKLWEHQRELDANGKPTISDGADLELFEDNKNMMPLVPDVDTDDADRWGLSTEKNYVDKIVRVENTGESDAYVRVFIAVPYELEKEFDGKAPLQWDLGGEFKPLDDTAYSIDEYANLFANQFDEAAKGAENRVAENYPIADENGNIQNYNIYCFTYNGALPAEGKDMTTAVMVGFYLDSAVDYNDVDKAYYMGDKTNKDNKINYDLDKDIRIPVYVQAIQAEGFESAEVAFNGVNQNSTADDNMPANPWATAADPNTGKMPDETPTCLRFMNQYLL